MPLKCLWAKLQNKDQNFWNIPRTVGMEEVWGQKYKEQNHHHNSCTRMDIMLSHRMGVEYIILFAYWLILHAFCYQLFLAKPTSSKQSFRNITRASNSGDPDLGPNCYKNQKKKTLELVFEAVKKITHIQQSQFRASYLFCQFILLSITLQKLSLSYDVNAFQWITSCHK